MACRRVIKVGERVVKDIASECHFSDILWSYSTHGVAPSSSPLDPIPADKEKPSDISNEKKT